MIGFVIVVLILVFAALAGPSASTAGPTRRTLAARAIRSARVDRTTRDSPTSFQPAARRPRAEDGSSVVRAVAIRRRRPDGSRPVRASPGAELESGHDSSSRALVDALEAALRVRDRLDRRPPGVGRLGRRSSRPRCRRSRCPGRASSTAVGRARPSCGVRVAVDLPPGRRVAAAAEHRQRPLDARAAPRPAIAGRFSTVDGQRSGSGRGGRRRASIVLVDLGPPPAGRRPRRSRSRRRDEPAERRARRPRTRRRRRRRARRPRPVAQASAIASPARGSGPARTAARTAS